MRCPLIIVLLLCTLPFQVFGQNVPAFQGAPAAIKPFKDSPLTAEEEQKTFTLPPGFQIELAAADPDIAKVVTVAFDDAGRMWAITAVEYPVDENESAERARALFASHGRDRVLVFDTPGAPGRQKPRTFADGLAIPLGVLPYRDGVIVGHGHDILFLRDTDGDGKADKQEVLLTGFGIQDSHLFPHQFTRGPGDWIYLAQGAFNYSPVKGRDGRVIQFDQCKMARFKPDGTHFEIVCWGPNNIWGFVIDRQGEMFIQEANDLGYPVVPFFIGANYPGIGMHKAKPYAPFQPPLANFQMGGTGLSGLALAEDRNGFPPPYRDVMYLANPITGHIQAIKIYRDGANGRLEKLPDFINCSDPWFRPVAIHFGPDGCLYIVDWYNKIISHNEVPRDHPERDKTRGRIWRVRHESMPRRIIPDLTRAGDNELVKHLGADSTWEGRAAWRQIVDRKATRLAPGLVKLVETPPGGRASPRADSSEGSLGSSGASPSRISSLEHPDHGRSGLRLLALWSLEGLERAGLNTLRKLAKEPNPNLRREAVRVLGTQRFSPDQIVRLLDGVAEDSDPQVRVEAIRVLDSLAHPDPKALTLLARMGKPALDGPTINPQQGGGPVHTGPAVDRDFERYLVRAALEKHPDEVAALLDSPAGKSLPLENQVLAMLAVGGKSAAARLAGIQPQLARPLSSEELILLAANVDHAEVRAAFTTLLAAPMTQSTYLKLLLLGRDRLDTVKLAAPIANATGALLRREPNEANYELTVRIAAAFRARELEPEVLAYTTREPQTTEHKLAGLRALREMGADQVDLFRRLAGSSVPGSALQKEAVTALASGKNDRAVSLLLEVWPALSGGLRKLAVDRLTGSRSGGLALVQAIKSGQIAQDEVDGYALDKLKTVLPNEPAVAELAAELANHSQRVLRLNGGDGDYVDTHIELRGPFTVETWIRLDPGIDNRDGILAGTNSADFNFHDSRFRVFAGREEGDVIVARKPVTAEMWTHVAVTRNARGEFRIYQNGELDNDQGKVCQRAFENLRIGYTLVPGGTAGLLTEFRVWNVERNADEIRDACNRSFQGEPRPNGLVYYCPGEGPWGRLSGQAQVEATLDYAPLLTAIEAKAVAAKFETFRQLAGQSGDATRGREVFKATCMVCHNVQGEGGQIGPTLNGAGAMGTEGLLRAILTPNAAMESGYRRFRVETTDHEVVEGFLVSQDEAGVVLRQVNSEDLRIPRSLIKRAAFTKTSVMPEGLLEAMKPGEIADLFAYLRALK